MYQSLTGDQKRQPASEKTCFTQIIGAKLKVDEYCHLQKTIK